MNSERRFQIEYALVERLMGKITLFFTLEEKVDAVEKVLPDILRDLPADFQPEKDYLADTAQRLQFIKEFFSYDILTDLLNDFEVEDIIINAINPIFVHHSQKGLTRTTKIFPTRKALDLFILKLVLFSGRKQLDKVMNIELPNLEGRVNMIKSPFGPQLTITKAKMSPLSILDLVKRGALSFEVAAQMWLYLEGMSLRPANMIIAGGPGVGKTTLLNTLFSFIPEGHRTVVIEDTLELNTVFEDSCARLESGEDFTLADLVRNSLRMRPERVIIGEVRGEEARDMLTAANIGKYCLGTIHALTSREAIVRLQNEPMNIPEELIRLIDVFIVLKRYHVGDKYFRVIDEVSETSGMEQEKVLLSQIYKYDYETNKTKSMTSSTVYRDRLAHEAGLMPKDIILEVQLRTFLLQQLAERGHTTLREVTSFCRAYTKDPDSAVQSLGFTRDELLGAEYMRERRKRRA